MKEGLDERINDGVPRWFAHVERMKNERIANRAYVEECDDNRSVARPWKRWIDTLKGWLKKKKRPGCQTSKENGA